MSTVLKDCERKGYINSKKGLSLAHQFSSPPQIYGLPKIYKEGSVNAKATSTSRNVDVASLFTRVPVSEVLVVISQCLQNDASLKD